jgi:hypothetical protein
MIEPIGEREYWDRDALVARVNALIAEHNAGEAPEMARLRAENERLRQPFAGQEPAHETCQLCGRAMGIGFHVDDETWKKLSLTGDKWGVLCPWCADKRAKEMGMTDVPTTFFINFDVLRDSTEPYEGAWQKRALAAEADVATLRAEWFGGAER